MVARITAAESPLMKKKHWQVRLGESEWTRHTHPPTPEDGLRLLGSVRRGAQLGALAVDRHGLYWQLNGDFATKLSQSQVAAAVRRAEEHQVAQRPSTAEGVQTRASQPTPVIIVKRRRRIVEPA
jgi:hypothetical protein